MKLQTFASIAERDVDLLLVEELSVNLDFGRWFFDQLGKRVVAERAVFECWRSVTDGALGESDLIARLDPDLAVLIENKIDAIAVVRLRVASIDRFAPVVEQENQVREGLEAAARLLELSRESSLDL